MLRAEHARDAGRTRPRYAPALATLVPVDARDTCEPDKLRLIGFRHAALEAIDGALLLGAVCIRPVARQKTELSPSSDSESDSMSLINRKWADASVACDTSGALRLFALGSFDSLGSFSFFVGRRLEGYNQ